ncbi:hydrogen dehydrogenase [Candidatus Magnetomorum sp. HK-1]|nr:hydrogen dehydrogenase [Candidatus Magnetomorum sp. HK-1]
MNKHITISPITRLEGHGKIDIILDNDGNVKDCFFQVVELRGFEKFCLERPVEEMSRITPKICGVCPGAHHMASSKAADAVYKVKIPSAAKKLRELFYNAHISHSHILHFFALGAPDFIPGSEADPSKRNILGLIEAVGMDIGKEVIKHRGYCQKIQGIIAGHPIHPTASIAGGMAKSLKEDERVEIEKMARSNVAFAQTALKIFDDLILANPSMVDIIASDIYIHKTHYMGLVDENKAVNFYDGLIRVVDPDGKVFAEFDSCDYLDHIEEHVEPWSYLKFPYLKSFGWKGLIDGNDSGIYRVNSLARLNVADKMATPLAQEAYEKMYNFFGHKPVHHTLAFHWARLIENMFAAEEMLRLACDPEITSNDVRTIPWEKPSEGVGVVEAARGTLIHHYKTDSQGLLKNVNLIVATVHNNAAMGMSVKKAAQKLIKNDAPDQSILNKIEMAFRAYDPCLACATHCLPGQMPMEVRLIQNGQIFRTLRQH